ncbi:4-carboxymuconolactone decarboxylase [Rhodoligotrophos appendicifer]|uniref:carboxymuconolactone decarboxylase family protein n=1 Tax=Rhodoligotrophos appendicifer TaxID=987056 RepID=UPI0011864D1D|nr:carboxymuconolactone decarboxylase family protein [Rhodoligotrophos appendicifer]
MTNRFKPFDPSELTPEQRVVFDDIRSGKRGTVPWIFHLFLNSPDLASRVQQLGAFCRYGTGLSAELSELAILIVAKHWGADYEWSIHKGEALKAGLSADIIDALDEGRKPDFTDPDAELIYDFATVFFATREVPDEIFQKAVGRFGKKTVLELTAVLGYYSMLAIAIRVFQLPNEV